MLLMRPHGFTALILPDFTSHDHGGVNEPFARLFDPAPMIASLAEVGIVARATLTLTLTLTLSLSLTLTR